MFPSSVTEKGITRVAILLEGPRSTPSAYRHVCVGKLRRTDARCAVTSRREKIEVVSFAVYKVRALHPKIRSQGPETATGRHFRAACLMFSAAAGPSFLLQSRDRLANSEWSDRTRPDDNTLSTTPQGAPLVHTALIFFYGVSCI